MLVPNLEVPQQLTWIFHFVALLSTILQLGLLGALIAVTSVGGFHVCTTLVHWRFVLFGCRYLSTVTISATKNQVSLVGNY